jgi:hypothetical protein
MREFVGLNFELVENTNTESIISNAYYLMTKTGIQQLCMRYDAIVRAKVNLKLEEYAAAKIAPQTYIEALKALIVKEEEKGK